MNKKKLIKKGLTAILAGTLFLGTFYNQENDAPPFYTKIKQETNNYGITTGFVSKIPKKTKTNGIVTSIFTTNNGTINGIDTKLFSNSKGITNGLDIGVISYTNTVNGAKIGWGNITKYLKGIEIGFWNQNKETKGIQIGIINDNYSSNFQGIQIGIINHYYKNFNMIFRYENNWTEKPKINKSIYYSIYLSSTLMISSLLIAGFLYAVRPRKEKNEKKEYTLLH